MSDEAGARAGLLGETIAALSTPRRLIPIVVVCAPLVAAQRSLSRDPMALPLGLAMCGLFASLAPYLWRRLMGARAQPRARAALGLLVYAACGAGVVALLGVVIPRALGMGRTFLTGRESLLVSTALFWVGGWGLGRDIEIEAKLARAEARARSLARAAERAELLALRSHLDPHFLFNTLNAIAEWCREDGEVAERAILKLSAILRTVLAGVRLERWAITRELQLVRDLFELHLFRDDELFTLAWEVPPEDALAGVTVPPMILLPLAENAVKHGPAAGHRGRVALAVSLMNDSTGRNGHVEVVIENPGPFRGRRPGGEGVSMVERRIALAYGAAASLSLEALEGATRATLQLPRERGEERRDG